MADSDVPSMGKIYEASQNLHESVRTFAGAQLGLTAAKRIVLKNLVRARWDMLTTDMHCAGYALEPEYVHHDVTTNKVSSCIKHPALCKNTFLKAIALCHLSTVRNSCRR